MRVLVIGATGFTGSHVVPLLVRSNYQVRCLVRKSGNATVLPKETELVDGDLDDPASLRRALDGVEVLVNIASLGFGHAPGIISSALAARIRRGVFISTTAVSTTLNAPSKTIRLAAEETIRESGLPYTILRPTMIYGSSRDRNICRLIRHLARWPVIPIFGKGEYLQQPVFVADVASAVVHSLGSNKAIGQTYNISGAAPLTYNELIDTVCRLLGRKVRKIHLPVRPAVAALAALEHLPWQLPVKAEQIRRLNEDKAFDYQAATRDFGYRPHSLIEGLRQELEEMRMVPVTEVLD